MVMRMKKAQKRKNILDAAAKVFSKDGYHQAKVEDIARMAGIGKGTIYLYFENKRHLYYCMLKEVYDVFLSHCVSRLNINGISNMYWDISILLISWIVIRK